MQPECSKKIAMPVKKRKEETRKRSIRKERVQKEWKGGCGCTGGGRERVKLQTFSN